MPAAHQHRVAAQHDGTAIGAMVPQFNQMVQIDHRRPVASEKQYGWQTPFPFMEIAAQQVALTCDHMQPGIASLRCEQQDVLVA